MSRLLISVLIGAVAGVIDVGPMIAQKLSKHACLSAFVHWVLLGVLISYVRLPLPAWLNGVVIAVLACLPVAILVSEREPKSTIPILSMSVVLGAAVGVATSRFAH
jgi:hypothetical protein